jgi:hypothetical protein
MATAKILHATRDHSGHHFLVHLDTTMTVGPHEAHELGLPEGMPHPHFMRRYDWPNQSRGSHQKPDPAAPPHDPAEPNLQPQLIDLTPEEYEAHIEAMIRQQAELELQGIRFYQPAPQPYEIIASLHGKELS